MLLAAFFVDTDVFSVKYALEGFPPLVLMPFRYALAAFASPETQRSRHTSTSVATARAGLVPGREILLTNNML
jgi:hypothetical protein